MEELKNLSILFFRLLCLYIFGVGTETVFQNITHMDNETSSVFSFIITGFLIIRIYMINETQKIKDMEELEKKIRKQHEPFISDIKLKP
jgi:hypothetical protein